MVETSRNETYVAPLTVSRPELLADGSDRGFRRLVQLLFAFFSLHESVRTGHVAYIGLPGFQYTILVAIGHLEADGPVGIKTVADHLRFSPSFVTVETGKLVKRGLVRKQRDSRDLRRVNLGVTDKGRGLLGKLAPVQRRVNDVQFECLGPGQLEELLRLVEELVANGERAVAL
ncbi:MAG: MarR family winged helix-turn-helix transcriptional regulator [Rhodospirillales bacterium]|nr:MarR family winged helix-turn-helix transcriptional regulator [Rhodospirillales bacterium]MDP6772647.1 MarR family winged helix-turn-helix transcriptional regulator [Rhodospirillales bacterium]